MRILIHLNINYNVIERGEYTEMRICLMSKYLEGKPESRSEERERERRKTGRAEARSGPTERNFTFLLLFILFLS